MSSLFIQVRRSKEKSNQRNMNSNCESTKRCLLFQDEYGKDLETVTSNFKILKKCQSKLNCLTSEMLFIHELKPKLNKECDSIHAKLFIL
ncbi:unnamed protein product [Porites evermanni]|uniref:Uncharacterized protein n=1 Tax=Porites evermanni TaxID=104178 RepID=A0ABN8PTA9_9CNID|nr:unnamed protein product [Porites evermanni]